jgi:uncharacterized protein
VNRRTFLKSAGAAAAAAIVGVSVHATAFEANDPKLVKIELPLTRLPTAWDGIRIVQLSDFHYDPYFSIVPIRKAVAVVNQLQPDLIVLTGDFITAPLLSSGPFAKGTGPLLSIEPCAELLGALHCRLGVLAILGNHDIVCGAETVMEALIAKNIKVLRNASFPLEIAQQRLWFGGVDDVLEGEPDLQRTLQNVPASEATVLLSHEPDFAEDVRRYPVDLQLSGHSHGGQIRLPIVGAPYLPDLGRRFPMGLYNLGRLKLYTNIGLGTIRIPARLNCPPEITLFTLRSRSGA